MNPTSLDRSRHRTWSSMAFPGLPATSISASKEYTRLTLDVTGATRTRCPTSFCALLERITPGRVLLTSVPTAGSKFTQKISPRLGARLMQTNSSLLFQLSPNPSSPADDRDPGSPPDV